MNRAEAFQSLSKTKKGEVAEQIVETELALRGYTVLQPRENERYDLAIEDGGKLLRIQVKTGYERERSPGRIVFDTSNNNTQRSEVNISKNYTSEQIDYFAVYSEITDEVYIVPVEETGTSEMTIRYDNPQKTDPNINWAEEYVIENILAR